MPTDVCVRRTSSRTATPKIPSTQPEKENTSTTTAHRNKRKQTLPAPDDSSTPRKRSAQFTLMANSHAQSQVANRNLIKNRSTKRTKQLTEESVLVVTGSSLPMRTLPAPELKIDSGCARVVKTPEQVAVASVKSMKAGANRRGETKTDDAKQLDLSIPESTRSSAVVRSDRKSMTDITTSDAALENERLEIEVSNPGVDVGANKGRTEVSHIAVEPKKLTKKEQAARRKEEAEKCFQKQRALFSEIDKHELHYGSELRQRIKLQAKVRHKRVGSLLHMLNFISMPSAYQ